MFFPGSITSAWPTARVMAAERRNAVPSRPVDSPMTAAGSISTASTRNMRPRI